MKWFAVVLLVAPAFAQDSPTDDEMDGITILGTPVEIARMGGSAHAADEDDLKAQKQDDAQRFLQTVPGVYVRDEDGFGLRPNIGLRGTSSERSSKITLMEDGVLLAPAPYAAPAAYYFPLAMRLTGIEVFKGPSAIKHGPNTIGGAINLVSRRIPRGGKGGVDIAGGQYETGKLHVHYGYGAEQWGVMIEGARLQSGGFKTLDGGGDTGFSKQEALAKVRLNTDPRSRFYHRLDLKFGYADESSNETYLGTTEEDFRDDPFRRYAASQLGLMDWTRTQAVAAYTFEFDEFTLRTTAYRNDFERSWRKLDSFASGPTLHELLNNPATGQAAVRIAILRGEEDSIASADNLLVGTNARSYVSQGVQLAGDWETETETTSHGIEAGARLHTDEIRRDHSQETYAMTGGRMIADGQGPRDTTQNRGSATAIAAYAQYELGLFDAVYLTPGLRFEHIRTRLENFAADTDDENQFSILLPGVGVFWQASEAWGLLAGVHRGFSPLAPGQSDEIEPETAINYEAGTRFGYQRVSGELVGFFSDYGNLTAECTFSAGCDESQVGQQFNGGEVLVYGLEALLKQNHPLFDGARIELELSYTLTVSEFQTSFVSNNPQFGAVEEGDALPYLPVHTGAAKANFSGPSWAFNASLQYTGEMRDSAGQGTIPDNERIDDRWIVDLLGRYEFGPYGAVYTKVENLTQVEYLASRRPFGARPGKPFQAMLGYTYDFEH